MPQITIFSGSSTPMLYMVWPQQPAPPVTLPPGYTLRQFRPADAQVYCDLVNLDSWQDMGWRCSARVLEYMITRTLPRGFFVVEDDATGALVATAMARHRPDAEDYDFPYGGELSLVFTHPDHRRQGLGYAVTGAVLTRLIEVGYPNIYLTTMDGRLPALRLYLRLGWLPFLPDDLPAAKLAERWQKVCAELAYPFTPEQWPRTVQVEQ